MTSTASVLLNQNPSPSYEDRSRKTEDRREKTSFLLSGWNPGGSSELFPSQPVTSSRSYDQQGDS